MSINNHDNNQRCMSITAGEKVPIDVWHYVQKMDVDMYGSCLGVGGIITYSVCAHEVWHVKDYTLTDIKHIAMMLIGNFFSTHWNKRLLAYICLEWVPQHFLRMWNTDVVVAFLSWTLMVTWYVHPHLYTYKRDRFQLPCHVGSRTPSSEGGTLIIIMNILSTFSQKDPLRVSWPRLTNTNITKKGLSFSGLWYPKLHDRSFEKKKSAYHKVGFIS